MADVFVRPSQSVLARAGAVGTAVAIVLVLVIYGLGRWAGDPLVVAPEFGGDPARLTIGVAAAATVAGGLVGTALAAGLARFSATPRPVFVVLCAVLLVGYGALAFVRAEQTSTGVWLNVMHLVAAVPVAGRLWFALGVEDGRPRGGPQRR